MHFINAKIFVLAWCMEANTNKFFWWQNGKKIPWKFSGDCRKKCITYSKPTVINFHFIFRCSMFSEVAMWKTEKSSTGKLGKRLFELWHYPVKFLSRYKYATRANGSNGFQCELSASKRGCGRGFCYFFGT